MIFRIFNEYTILHLIIYIIIGYYYPNKWIFIIIISFLWEIIEYILDKYKMCSFCEEIIMNKIIDIIFNLLGYYLGNIIAFKNI